MKSTIKAFHSICSFPWFEERSSEYLNPPTQNSKRINFFVQDLISTHPVTRAVCTDIANSRSTDTAHSDDLPHVERLQAYLAVLTRRPGCLHFIHLSAHHFCCLIYPGASPISRRAWPNTPLQNHLFIEDESQNFDEMRSVASSSPARGRFCNFCNCSLSSSKTVHFVRR